MRATMPLLILSAILATGCSILPSSRTRNAAPVDEVSELQRHILELQRQAAKDDVEIARLRDQLAAARASAPARPKTTPPTAAIATSAKAKQAEPAAATIQSEDLQLSPSEKADRPAAGAQGITPEMQALYDRGYTAFHERRYASAETTFQGFLVRYPSSELADNASYWIGEARLQQQDTRGALAAFKSTVEKYPQGNKVPDALLKVGECMESLGDLEAARLSYQEVARRFPNTAAAEVAKEREAQLK